MGAGHAHGHVTVDRTGQSQALILALVVNLLYTAGEAVAGVLTDSLALLADAGHNLSDVFALGIALAAARLATRPPTARSSFGYQRAEILSALANGVILVAISIWIFIEAAQRLANPPEVEGGWVILVAAIGILVNGLTGWMLLRVGRESLNVRAAALHLGGDALASVGVVLSGVIIVTTGWLEVDPLISIVIGVLILVGTWSTLRDSVEVLLEQAPRGLDVEELGRRMAALPGVVEVHDLHIWTITSGFPALSAHVLVQRDDDCHARRHELEELLAHEYGIEHTTLQVEHAGELSGLLQLERFGPGDT
jgi:cobalt-zinc-cadmium efflux system protein